MIKGFIEVKLLKVKMKNVESLLYFVCCNVVKGPCSTRGGKLYGVILSDIRSEI